MAIGERRYRYNAEHRPVTLTVNGRLKATWAYNAFGERVKQTRYANGHTQVRYFLYDGHHRTATADAGGTVLSQIVYVGPRPIARLAGRRIQAIHADALDAPIAVTDAAGQTLWSASYAAFGRARVHVQKIRFSLRRPGQYADGVPGVYYNYFRDYDTATGRYLTADPSGLNGGLNPYAYVGANPLNRIDPIGLRPISVDAGGTPVPAGTPTKPSAEDAASIKRDVVLNSARAVLTNDYHDKVGLQLLTEVFSAQNIAALLAIQLVPGLDVYVDYTIVVANGVEGAYFVWELASIARAMHATGVCETAALVGLGRRLAQAVERGGAALGGSLSVSRKINELMRGIKTVAQASTRLAKSATGKALGYLSRGWSTVRGVFGKSKPKPERRPVANEPPKRLPAPPRTAVLRQEDLSTIVANRFPQSAHPGPGRFNNDISLKTISATIKDAVKSGTARTRRGEDGTQETVYTYDTGKPVGVDAEGNPTNKIEVVVREDGTVRDAGPHTSTHRASTAGGTGAKFANNKRLTDHYDRHGKDFGARNKNEYQKQADAFLTGKKNSDTLEGTRSDGDIVRYNEKTDEFGILSKDGVIRTYYKPDPVRHGYPTNKAYFYAQLRR